MASQAFMSRSIVSIGGYILCLGYAVIVTSVWGQSTTPSLDRENGFTETFIPLEKTGDPTSVPQVASSTMASPEHLHTPYLLVGGWGSDGADNYRTNSLIIEPSQSSHDGQSETITTVDKMVIKGSLSESMDIYQQGDKTADAGYLKSSIMDSLHSSIAMDISMEKHQTRWSIPSRSTTVLQEMIRLDSSVIHQTSPSDALHHSTPVWRTGYHTDQPVYVGTNTQLTDTPSPVSHQINTMPLTSVLNLTSSFMGVMPTRTATFHDRQTTKSTSIPPMSAHVEIPDHTDLFNYSRSSERFDTTILPTSVHRDVPFPSGFSNPSGYSESSVLPSENEVSSSIQITSLSETMWATSETVWATSETMWSMAISETMWSASSPTDSMMVYSSSEINLSSSSYQILNQSASTDLWILESSLPMISGDSVILASSSQSEVSSHMYTISPMFPDSKSQNVSESLISSSVPTSSFPATMSTMEQFNMTSASIHPSQYVSSSVPVIIVTSYLYSEISGSEMTHTHEPLYTAMISSHKMSTFYPESSSSPVFSHSIVMPSLAYSSVPYIESLIYSTKSVLYPVPSTTVERSTSMPNSSSFYPSSREPLEYQSTLSVDMEATMLSSLSDSYGLTHSVSHYPMPSVTTAEEISSPDLVYITPSESLSETFYPIMATVPLYDYSSKILADSDVLEETVFPISPTVEPQHMSSTPVQEVTMFLSAIPTSSAAPPVRTTTSPAVEYINQKFLLTFNGDCQPLVGHLDRVQEFQSQVKGVIVVYLGLDESSVYMDRLVCGSVKSSVIIYNATQNYSAEISDLVSSGDFLVQMRFADLNITETYRAYKVEEVSLEEKVTQDGSGEQKGDDGLDDKDIILIVLACCICAVLIIIGVVVCAKQMYRKKYAQSFNLMDTPHVNLKMEDFTLTRIPRPRASYGEDGVQVQSYYQSNGHALVRPVPPPRQNFTRHSQQNSQSSDFDSTFDRSVDINDVRIDDNKTSSFVQNSRPFTYTPHGNDLGSKDNGGYVARSRSIDSESTVHDRSTENLVPGMNGSRLQGSVNPIYSGDDTEATASIASDPPPYTDDHPVGM